MLYQIVRLSFTNNPPQSRRVVSAFFSPPLAEHRRVAFVALPQKNDFLKPKSFSFRGLFYLFSSVFCSLSCCNYSAIRCINYYWLSISYINRYRQILIKNVFSSLFATMLQCYVYKFLIFNVYYRWIVTILCRFVK